MVSLKQLNYAVAVEKLRHFKRAAQHCSVSQSALSSAIAELEHQLGVALFERDNKHVFVTPVGVQVLALAKRILAQVDELESLPLAAVEPLVYPMRIGVIPTVGPYLLPQVLPFVRRQYPDFRLSIVEELSHRLLELVKTGALDAAIIALPYAVDGFWVEEFWSENFVLVAHKSDELASHTVLSTAEIDPQKLLLLPEGHCLKNHALAACQLAAMPPYEGLGNVSLYTIIQMVAGNMGATLIPEMALNSLISSASELVALPLKEPGPHRSIAILSRPNYNGKASLTRLAELFRQQLQQGWGA